MWRNARFVRQDRKKEVWVGDESSGVRAVRLQSRPRDRTRAVEVRLKSYLNLYRVSID